MNSTATLTGSHLRTYQTIFQHPVSHNLGWRDVHALLRHIAQVDEEANGNLKVTRHGESLVLPRARTKDVSTADEVLALRHFIERSDAAAPAANLGAANWLVVVDHRESRIYRSTAPEAKPQLIRPHAPEDFFRHAPNSQQISRGKEKPDPNSYFEPVAGVLHGARRILIFGNGTGTANEMDQFVTWVKKHHPELAQRIVGTAVVDEHHLTEPQLLAQAREFFANCGVHD